MRRSDQEAARDDVFTMPRVGAGFVALVAVGGLLGLLRHLIGRGGTINPNVGPKSIDNSVTRLWVTARQLAQNTQALQHVKTTRERAAALVEELERHHQPTGGNPR